MPGHFTTASESAVKIALKTQPWGTVNQKQKMKTEPFRAPEVQRKGLPAATPLAATYRRAKEGTA